MGGGLSAEEMQAAMQSVEDETDQAAAQALALETEAELAEFNADPVPKPADPEGDEEDADAEETRYEMHRCGGGEWGQEPLHVMYGLTTLFAGLTS